MNILIIEDEALSAEDLMETINQVDSSAHITAILHSVREARQYLHTRPAIDLIFSDIQLGDGVSFEIFRNEPSEVPIIFCTAYDEYAIEAFKNNGIDYILKPFNKEMINAALERYHRLKSHFGTGKRIDYNAVLSSLSKNSTENKSSILVSQKNGVLPVRIKDIALIFIDSDVTRILCFNQSSYIIGQTLDQLEKITGSSFFRANRQYLINRDAVVTATNYFPRKYQVALSVPFNGPIIISKEKASSFFSWLEQM